MHEYGSLPLRHRYNITYLCRHSPSEPTCTQPTHAIRTRVLMQRESNVYLNIENIAAIEQHRTEEMRIETDM